MPTNFELTRRSLVAVVTLVIASLVGLVAFIYLPAAKITLFPATVNRTATADITLSTQATAPDFVHPTLPTKIVEKELEDSKTVERSSTDTHDDFAKGAVTLVNEQPDEQPLLPKTHLRHEATGVQFLTDKAVRIPPQGEIAVSVTAEQKGASGNVPPGKFIIDKLPESVQKVMYGKSDQAFTGGVASSSAITQAEIDRASEQLMQDLKQRAAGELTLAAGGAISPDLVQVETISADSSASAGSFATSFSIHTKIHARAFVADQNDLLSLTLIALRASASSEEEFISYDPKSFQPKIIQADFERGLARVQGSLNGTFAQKIEPTVLSPEKLAGLGEKETIEYFKQFPSVAKVEVSFSPFWVHSIPSRPSATEIAVKND